MLKKIHNYQKYCRTIMNSTEMSEENGFIFPMILFLSLVVGSMSAIEMGFWDYLMVAMFGMASMLYSSDSKRTMLRQIPVSDKFAVLNIIVIFPLYWSVVGTIILGVIMVLSGGIMFVFTSEAPSMIDVSVLAEWGLQMVIHLIIWAIIMLVSFCQGRWKKISILIGTALVFGIGNWCISQRLEHYQYYGNYSYFEAVQLLPHGKVIIVALIVVAVLVWIYTWKKCLTLYRRDVKGQKTSKEAKAKPIKSYQRKSSVAVIVVCLVASVFFIGSLAIFIFEKGEECAIVTENPQDYQKFSTCLEEVGVKSDVYFLESNQSIFPESIDNMEVEEYYAAVEGEYGDGWSSLTWERLLVVNYTEETYKTEKDRVSTLSISYEDQTNNVLKDTEHFVHEAYIAVYNDLWSTYEYALFDDESYQVAYVFLQDSSPYDLDTDSDICIKQSKSNIIPIKIANDEDGGYSIYSFWNKEWSCYETWWPGKE